MEPQGSCSNAVNSHKSHMTMAMVEIDNNTLLLTEIFIYTCFVVMQLWPELEEFLSPSCSASLLTIQYICYRICNLY